ncbi:MAG TPA: energy transducer TonB [Terracidiphilus sp.]|jgi:TonB family protein|nr:energy transducer TonB [Terracidiphilus sp.]
MGKGNEGRGTASSLHSTRVKLLLAAGMTAMVALMLPPAPQKSRVVKSRIEPEYPELARQLGITGRVRMAVTVDCIGRVVQVQTVSGEMMLAEAAEAAVRRWKFTPGRGEVMVPVELSFPLAS